MSATGVHRTEGFDYAIDNGAWTAYQRGEPFDEGAFEKLLSKLGRGANFIVIPDIVGGGHRSLEFSLDWLPRLRKYETRLLLAVQDGLEGEDIAHLLDQEVGIFVGGTTEWKLKTMTTWGQVARDRDCYLHVGRVNSAKRISLCQEAGAHSFDGTSASMYAKTLPKLDGARRQTSIFDRRRHDRDQ